MKIKVIFVVFILLSAISLIPVVQGEAIEDSEQKEILSKLNTLKSRLTEELGEEKYQEIERDVSHIVHEQFSQSTNPNPDSPLYDLLKEIAVIIVAIMVLLFGNNPVGYGLGAFACLLLLSIPVLVVAIGVSVFDMLCLPYLETDIVELIEQFGIIGTMIIFILAIPILAVLIALAFVVYVPMVWAILMGELIQYALSHQNYS